MKPISRNALNPHAAMPAPLKRADGSGITMINIGVGLNAKTITDHVAVCAPPWRLRAGLRNSQSLGDYVLAHGYLANNVLYRDLTPAFRAALSEIQVALEGGGTGHRHGDMI
jgi:AMP nucleosidase